MLGLESSDNSVLSHGQCRHARARVWSEDTKQRAARDGVFCGAGVARESCEDGDAG